MKNNSIFGVLVMVLAISACKKEAVKNNYTATNGKTTNTNLNGTPANGLSHTFAQVNASLLASGYVVIPSNPGFTNRFTNNLGVHYYFNASLNKYAAVYNFGGNLPGYLPGQTQCDRKAIQHADGHEECTEPGSECFVTLVYVGGNLVDGKVICCD